MQWTASAQAGFTTGTPWIKVNPNYHEINAQAALDDPDSIFAYYQQLIRLRKLHPVIVYGTYDLILESHEQIYAFTRTFQDEQLLVLLNFTNDAPMITLPNQLNLNNRELLIGNYASIETDDGVQLTLRPFEARVYRQR
jgi:oligo-1,6-glucosidase